MMADWDITWTVTKEDLAGRVIEVVTFEHNGLTTLGKNFILNAILGTATTDFSSGPYLGVGNGTAIFAPSQTNLQGTVTTYAGCSEALVTGGELFWSSLFTFPATPRVWAEFAIFDQFPYPGANQITDFYWGVQNGDVSDPTGGTFDLTNPSFSSITLPFDAGSIGDAALQALFDVVFSAGNTLVTDTEPGYFRLELTGVNASTPITSPAWSLDPANLTGPDAPYSGSPDPIQSGESPIVALMLNRRVANLGTQPTSQQWRLNASGRLQG